MLTGYVHVWYEGVYIYVYVGGNMGMSQKNVEFPNNPVFEYPRIKVFHS